MSEVKDATYKLLDVKCCHNCHHGDPTGDGCITCQRGIGWDAVRGMPAGWGPLVDALGVCDAHELPGVSSDIIYANGTSSHVTSYAPTRDGEWPNY